MFKTFSSIAALYFQKPAAFGKKAKSPKTVRKRSAIPDQTPEPEPSLDVIPAVDENLLKMIENSDGALELSEETLNQFAPAEDFQEPDVISVSEENPIKTSGRLMDHDVIL